MSMLDRNAYRHERAADARKTWRLSPDALAGYLTLRGDGAKTGRVDAKTRELTALAAVVALCRDSWITAHVVAARRCDAIDALPEA